MFVWVFAASIYQPTNKVSGRAAWRALNLPTNQPTGRMGWGAANQPTNQKKNKQPAKPTDKTNKPTNQQFNRPQKVTQTNPTQPDLT